MLVGWQQKSFCIGFLICVKSMLVSFRSIEVRLLSLLITGKAEFGEPMHSLHSEPYYYGTAYF